MTTSESKELVDRMGEFVAERVGVRPERLNLNTDVIMDIWGADVWELIEEFGKEFRVDLRTFDPKQHTGPEGCGCLLFGLTSVPAWEHKHFIPIYLKDLVESARRGTWSIQYPAKKNRPVA